jgi:DNA-binding LytR/AlgR family response regulator
LTAFDRPIHVAVFCPDLTARSVIEDVLNNDRDIGYFGDFKDISEAAQFSSEHAADILIADLSGQVLCQGNDLNSVVAYDIPVVILISETKAPFTLVAGMERVYTLLKPFTEDEMAFLLKKSKESLLRNRIRSLGELLNLYSQKFGVDREPHLVIELNAKGGMIQGKRIDWIEADENYVVAHCGDQEFRIRSSLQDTLALLAPAGFVRVNRAIIIRRDVIKGIAAMEDGRRVVILGNGERFTISRKNESQLKRELS